MDICKHNAMAVAQALRELDTAARVQAQQITNLRGGLAAAMERLADLEQTVAQLRASTTGSGPSVR